MSLKETLSANNERLRAIKAKVDELEKIIPEDRTVELALAGGDQVVTPSGGKIISKVTIEKPETLLPENILNGVTIAGVAGFAFKVATGTITGNGSKIQMNKAISVTGLGFKPKYVCVRRSNGYMSSSLSDYYLVMCEYGLRYGVVRTKGGKQYTNEYDWGSSTGYRFLEFNEDGFDFWTANIGCVFSGTYTYIAIG